MFRPMNTLYFATMLLARKRYKTVTETTAVDLVHASVPSMFRATFPVQGHNLGAQATCKGIFEVSMTYVPNFFAPGFVGEVRLRQHTGTVYMPHMHTSYTCI